MGQELPDEALSSARLARLASELGQLTEEDMMLLANVSPGTLESWRKRGDGPAYVRAGNRFFYPRDAVARWMDTRVKERPWTSVRVPI